MSNTLTASLPPGRPTSSPCDGVALSDGERASLS